VKKTSVFVLALAVALSSCFVSSVPADNTAKADGPFEWIQVNNGLTDKYVSSLAIDPTNTQVIYAGTNDSADDSGVFKSTDGGTSWTRMSNGLTGLRVRSLAIDPANSQVVYAGTSEYVFKSTNGGTLWTRMNNGLVNSFGYVSSLVIGPTNAPGIYAGTSERGIFKSMDSASSWTQMNNGLTSLVVYSLAIGPTNTQVVYAATKNGVFKSTNGGTSWTLTGLTSTSTHTILRSLAVDPTNTQVFYSGAEDGYVYKSTNGGSSWTQSGVATGSLDILSLAVDPTNTQVVYAGAAASISSSGGVFKSTDGGSSWTGIGNGLTHLYVDCLAIDPTHTQVVYAGTNGDGVFKSTTLSSYVLTTTASPSAGGTISRSPNASSYAPGTVVTLTATPAAGYTLVGWSGDLSGLPTNPPTVTMDANKTVTATFAVAVKKFIIELKIGSTTMLVDGRSVTLEAAPIILNARTLLPIRAVVEAVGGTIAWEALARKVTIVRNATTLELWIGRHVAELNGQSTTIDSDAKVVPIIMNGRTLLPLRFVAEALALDVQWNATTRTVTITFTP
jgi:uncharacterized repeat protein (TIGR02543 family)